MNSLILLLLIAGNLLVQASSAENPAAASTGGAGDHSKKKSPSKSKGIVLSKGGIGNKKINVSSITSAQAAGVEILHALPESSGKETFVPKNSNAKHIRYGQLIHGMDVEGASLYVHLDKFGTVVGVNGEIVDETLVPSIPTIDSGMAIEAALNESRVPADEHDNCSPPTLTVVRGLMDGEAHLAWTCTVRYDILGEDGYLKPFNDQIFARATGGNPGLIQIHPKIYGARSLETRNCKQTTTTCPIASTSPNKIVLPSDLPVEAAHNYAIDTYDYYWQKHGRDSIDNNGMKLISLVHYDEKLNNAFWDGTKMIYGDGDGIELGPLSLAVDVVAHELTHGVTQITSGLIYYEESGALNEALSDIFSAFVEFFLGSNESDIWRIGEDAWTPGVAGDAMRYMCDPALAGDRDYYPDRYQGPDDDGGVHTNSGIANLAACLLAKGGTHPRGKAPGVIVPAIGYDALELIFYKANTHCLTPSSNFVAARWCTADVFGESNKDKVHLGWDAVGVPRNDPPPPPCAAGYVDCVNGYERGSSVTCEAACNGKCCLDNEEFRDKCNFVDHPYCGDRSGTPCMGFTGKVCMDYGSCMGSHACRDATVPYIAAPSYDRGSCEGELSCARAGRNGKVGNIVNSCSSSLNCFRIGESGTVGDITDSCFGFLSCYGIGRGGFAGSITKSCRGTLSCTGLGADSAFCGPVFYPLVGAEESLPNYSMICGTGRGVITDLDACCNNSYECIESNAVAAACIGYWRHYRSIVCTSFWRNNRGWDASCFTVLSVCPQEYSRGTNYPIGSKMAIDDSVNMGNPAYLDIFECSAMSIDVPYCCLGFEGTGINVPCPSCGGAASEVCAYIALRNRCSNGTSTHMPTGKPTLMSTSTPPMPSIKPTAKSSFLPTHMPTGKPTTPTPTYKPTRTMPTGKPTPMPTYKPTSKPTGKPILKPTSKPTSKPTVTPTYKPTGKPTVTPTYKPTGKPTVTPTYKPTGKPTLKPTGKPTVTPTSKPTSKPKVQAADDLHHSTS